MIDAERLDQSHDVHRDDDRHEERERGLKCAASMLGFGNGLMAEPYFALREEEREGIRATLEALGLLKVPVTL